MRSVEIENARRDMLQWGMPIVVDLVRDCYARLFGPQQHSTLIMSSSHARLWRALLVGDSAKLSKVRGDLTSLGLLVGLPKSIIDSIDQDVLDELLTVITIRFTRSPSVAQMYSRLLLTASADLAEMRIMAAA